MWHCGGKLKGELECPFRKVREHWGFECGKLQLSLMQSPFEYAEIHPRLLLHNTNLGTERLQPGNNHIASRDVGKGSPWTLNWPWE